MDVTFTATGFKGLKATNELQRNGIGILHQTAQHYMDQVSLYTCKTYRDKVLAAEHVDLCAPPNPLSLAQRGS